MEIPQLTNTCYIWNLAELLTIAERKSAKESEISVVFREM